MNKVLTQERETPTLENLSVIAIEELDAHIGKMLRGGKAFVSYRFLDWVADELTKTILFQLESIFQTRQFQDSLRLGDPRIAVAFWVKRWACGEIKTHFPDYVSLCACTQVITFQRR